MAKFLQTKSRISKTTRAGSVAAAVNTVTAQGPRSSEIPIVVKNKKEPEIDFSSKSDLESYVHGLAIPASSVERWISTGLLFPDETRVAEKMLKIIRTGFKKPLN